MFEIFSFSFSCILRFFSLLGEVWFRSIDNLVFVIEIIFLFGFIQPFFIIKFSNMFLNPNFMISVPLQNVQTRRNLPPQPPPPSTVLRRNEIRLKTIFFYFRNTTENKTRSYFSFSEVHENIYISTFLSFSCHLANR